jgi:hypothetical protein
MDKDSIVKAILNTNSNSLFFSDLEGSEHHNATFAIHPKEFPMFKMNNIPVPEDDGSVSYHYNSLGFRSDDFVKKTDSKKNRFVFAGCSEGEGIGGNIEDSWTGMTYNAIKDELSLDGFYNLSIDNFGFQKIIMNCLLYVKEFGKPDAFVVLFPDVARVFKWLDSENSYTIEWKDLNHLEIKENRKLYMDSMVDFILYINMFEEYCRTNQIKLFWSTWSRLENSVLSELNFSKNFIEFNYHPDFFEYKQNEVIKRDGHQGLNAHKVWSTNLINAIIDYAKNNKQA